MADGPSKPTPGPAGDDPDLSPDEMDLVAYLDGELEGDEIRNVETRLAADPDARVQAAALKKTYDLLDHLPRPEPSSDFTQRTLTRIDMPGESPRQPTTSAQSMVRSPNTSKRAWGLIAWAVAGLLATAGGYIGHKYIPNETTRESADLSFDDVRVIELLPLYLGVDDLDFLRRLDDADLFPHEPGNADALGNPDAREMVAPAHRDELRKLFRAFPPARQQQLRLFDQQLHELEPPIRERLKRTLERYAVWLDRLPDPERREVLVAPSPAERFEAIRRVKQRLWRAALPTSHRARLDAARNATELTDHIEDLKKQESERRAGWELARLQWDSFKNLARPWPFGEEPLAEEVDRYARYNLRPRLTISEAAAIDRLRQDLYQESGADTKWLQWFLYGSMLLELSDRHPTLPEFGMGFKPILREADLPEHFVRDLQAAAVIKSGGTRKILMNAPIGRWPDFAEAVAKEAVDLGVKVRFPIGPSRPGEFTQLMNEFIGITLKSKLRKVEWEALRLEEGKWPEYPRKVLDLARSRDLSVPGVALPGPPSKWLKYYRPQRLRK